MRAYSRAMVHVRDLEVRDLPAVAEIALACNEVGPVSASQPRYLDHVARRGSVVVSGSGRSVEGYGGVVDVQGAAFVTDLFVAPGSRGAGHGRALLDHLWVDDRPRVTSSSQDPRALAAYARFGARPLWPLLYLQVPGADVRPWVPVIHEPAVDGDAGWRLEVDEASTVRVRSAPGTVATTAVVLTRPGRVVVLRAETPDPRGLAVLVADLRSRAGVGGVVEIVVPGPHPGLPDLIQAGARVVDVDLWCASAGAADLVDPTRALPSPALA
jgi:GNAT superfamily N-acetyltransferase